MYHEHPIRIIRYSIRNLWLMIIPLLRGISVYHFRAADIFVWIKGAWMDILVMGMIIMFGFVRWYFTRIYVENDSIILIQGVILRIRTTIPFENVSMTIAERPLWLRPLSGVIMKCDTRAGILKSIDMKLLVTDRVCAQLSKVIPKLDVDKLVTDMPKPTALSVLLFSVFFSSGFSGVVYIATFFFKGGDISRDLINLYISRISETAEKLNDSFLMKIPAAAVGAGIFFLVSWLISFIINLLRYAKFDLKLDGEQLQVCFGVLNRRECHIRNRHINYTDIRQNLLMRLLGAVTVDISCAGYGSGSKHLPVLLPVKREKDLSGVLRNIGIPDSIETEFRPPLNSFPSYTLNPVLLGLLLYPLRKIALLFLPNISELIDFTFIMMYIPLAWFLLIQFTALRSNGIKIYKDQIVVRTAKGTSFHTVIADTDNVVKIGIEQTIVQRLNKKCKLVLWFSGEGTSRYQIKAIYRKDAEKIKKIIEDSRNGNINNALFKIHKDEPKNID